MTVAEHIWLGVLVFLLLGAAVNHVLTRRRQRFYEEFEARRRARKQEVERQARKAL